MSLCAHRKKGFKKMDTKVLILVVEKGSVCCFCAYLYVQWGEGEIMDVDLFATNKKKCGVFFWGGGE